MLSASTAACRSALTTPGSTMAMRSSTLMSTIFFMRSVESTRPPRTGSAPPVMPVPVPRGVTGTLCSAASRSTSSISARESHSTAASGGNTPRPDSSRP